MDAPDRAAIPHTMARRADDWIGHHDKAQLNLFIRRPRSGAPEYVEAVIWPYRWHHRLNDQYVDGFTFHRPGHGPGTLRVAILPPDDGAAAVRFLFAAFRAGHGVYECPIPDGFFGLPASERRAYVIGWVRALLTTGGERRGRR